LFNDALQSLDRFFTQRRQYLGPLGHLGVVLGGQRAEVTIFGVAEQYLRQQRALRVLFLEVLRGFVGLVVIAGQMIRRHEPLRDLFFATGQELLRENRVVGGRRLLGLFERLLRVAHVEKDLAAARAGFGIGAGQLLSAFGGGAIGIQCRLQ